MNYHSTQAVDIGGQWERKKVETWSAQQVHCPAICSWRGIGLVGFSFKSYLFNEAGLVWFSLKSNLFNEVGVHSVKKVLPGYKVEDLPERWFLSPPSDSHKYKPFKAMDWIFNKCTNWIAKWMFCSVALLHHYRSFVYTVSGWVGREAEMGWFYNVYHILYILYILYTHCILYSSENLLLNTLSLLHSRQRACKPESMSTSE